MAIFVRMPNALINPHDSGHTVLSWDMAVRMLADSLLDPPEPGEAEMILKRAVLAETGIDLLKHPELIESSNGGDLTGFDNITINN